MMGSGPRFHFQWIKGLMFGITVERFPYDLTISISIGPLLLSYGFGRAYDDPEGADHE